jgi:glycosyltransferase involved in cell wall biosynthesis
MSPPDVTIVVPVWGDYAGDGLREALASLTEQSLSARIIVVDNASEPPIGELPGVEVLRSEQRITVGAARNFGLARVSSPYVIFWDADDLMLPGTLLFLRDRIAADPELVLAAAAIVEGDPPVPHRWPRRWTYRFTRFRTPFAFAHCIWSLFPTTGSSIIRTADAQAAGFGDANSGEDWVLGVSLAFRGRVTLETRPGRLYRSHPSSLWATQRSGRQLMLHSRSVRERIRHDPAAPPRVQALLPAIAAFQFIAVRIVRPLVEAARVVRASRGVQSR